MSQLKDMAERFPVEAKTSIFSSLVPFISAPTPNDNSVAADEQLSNCSSTITSHEMDSNGLLVSSIPISISNSKKVGVSEVRNGSKETDSNFCIPSEWVEQDEPGVYLTLTSLPGGIKDLKRVRFRYL